tara:strand:+ start:3422 stop:4732 length:1311 start_codon:yes stop_codon:yes gene_type:complete
MNKKLFLQDVFNLLNKKTNYAVLRSFDGLPEDFKSRDIDIMIDRNDFKSFLTEFLSIINEHNYKIIKLKKTYKMYIFVLSYVNLDTNFIDIIQFDFFFNTSIYGVEFLTSSEILDKKLFNGKIYHVSDEYQFLDKFLYTKALNQDYPDKYQAIARKVKDSSHLSILLQKKFKVNSLSEIKNMSRRSYLLLMFKLGSNKNLFSKIVDIILFLKDCVSKESAKSIAFTGPDGAGKSTLIRNLMDILEPYHMLSYKHFRPHIIPNIGQVVSTLTGNKNINLDYSQPHRSKPKGMINSFCRMLYYSFDYLIGDYVERIRNSFSRSGEKNDIIFFDRYFTDIVVDSRRSSIFLPFKFIYNFYKAFIPKPDFVFFITCDPEIILKRKQELKKEDIDCMNFKIHSALLHNSFLINNGKCEKHGVAQIMSIYADKVHACNEKMI